MKFIFYLFFLTSIFEKPFCVPVHITNRQEISKIELTKIGQFGLLRKARPGIPAHYHTGIDIKRPNNNYAAEPIFPIATGRIISKRTDGPYANLIIEHNINGLIFWTVYEHIAGIKVKVGDTVNPFDPVVRFMNEEELYRHGWQFDHFHLEVLKVKPKAVKGNKSTPERYFDSYSLTCYNKDDLYKYFYNPIEFLSNQTNQ